MDGGKGRKPWEGDELAQGWGGAGQISPAACVCAARELRRVLILQVVENNKNTSNISCCENYEIQILVSLGKALLPLRPAHSFVYFLCQCLHCSDRVVSL